MPNPTVIFNISYYGYNNYGQHSAGQGIINNISSQTTESTSSSDLPETSIRCPREVQFKHQPVGTTILPACKDQSEDQPTTIRSAREIQSEDQPPESKSPESKSPLETTIHFAGEAQSEDQPVEIKNSPETTTLPARADESIADTTNADRTAPRNIVVFGQATSGKTSIIDLLVGSSVANLPRGPANCNKPHFISNGDDNYMFWDTPGLDEAENGGSVSLGDDVANLLNLVKDHGVNLLVYCIRGTVADITRVNYDFFWKIVCVEEVPIVLVVMGLEGRVDMDEWWQENIKAINKMKMVFAGHACITSWKGMGGNMYEREYETSTEKIWKLVRDHSTPKPWYMTREWSVQAQQRIAAYEKHFKARTMRKLLKELSRSLC